MAVNLNTEPVVLIEVVKAIVALVVVFVTLPVGLEAALIGVVLAAGAMFQRSKVTPV